MQYYPDTTQNRKQQGTNCVSDQGSFPQPHRGAQFHSTHESRQHCLKPLGLAGPRSQQKIQITKTFRWVLLKMAGDYNGGNKIHYIVFNIYLIPSYRLIRQESPHSEPQEPPPTPRRSEWLSGEEPDLKRQQPRAKGENERISCNRRRQKTQHKDTITIQEAKPHTPTEGMGRPKSKIGKIKREYDIEAIM